VTEALKAPQDPHGLVLPVTDDPETAGFWSAAAEGRLVLRVCPTCDTVLHLPRAFCARCRTAGESWLDVDGGGALYSWTTVEHQVHPAYPTPYTVVLVELNGRPGVRMVGRLDGRPELTIGMPMSVFFQEVDGVVLPQWRPEEHVA
jgi:uncharacterized protein